MLIYLCAFLYSFCYFSFYLEINQSFFSYMVTFLSNLMYAESESINIFISEDSELGKFHCYILK